MEPIYVLMPLGVTRKSSTLITVHANHSLIYLGQEKLHKIWNLKTCVPPPASYLKAMGDIGLSLQSLLLFQIAIYLNNKVDTVIYSQGDKLNM